MELSPILSATIESAVIGDFQEPKGASCMSDDRCKV
jgi:hypothetical protein